MNGYQYRNVIAATDVNGDGTGAITLYSLPALLTVTGALNTVPVFDGLHATYTVGQSIPLNVKGTGSDKLTTIRVTIDGTVLYTATAPSFPDAYTPAAAGRYLIEAISDNETLRIWKYVTVTP